jgi:hypothetical protein
VKKIAYPFLGAIIACLICNVLFLGAGRIAVALGIRLYNSEEEASRNFLILGVSLSIFIFFGFFYGYLKAKKSKK